MAITRKGLINFKKEVENNLLSVKNDFIIDMLNTFVRNAPIPNIAEYALGPYINTTKLQIGNNKQDLNIVKYRTPTYIMHKNGGIEETNDHKQYIALLKYITINKNFVQKEEKFKIKKPYDNIYLTNYVYYSVLVEDIGWKKTPPYHTISRTSRSVRRKLDELCKNIK